MYTLEMNLRKFDMDHYNELNTWYYERKGHSFPKQNLSSTGLIVPGIAAGFLIKTDAGFGILEPFISNPKAPKNLRHEALKLILSELTELAAEYGYKHVYGFSTNRPMIERALEQEFKIIESNSTTVVKELK